MTAKTDTFNTDWDTFKDGLNAHDAAVQRLADDNNQYNTLLAKFLAMRNNPEEALLYFLAIMSASTEPNDSANILGRLDDQMGIVGQALKVTAEATQLTNDVQNITNCTATNPDGTSISLQDLCAHLDELLDAFNPGGPGNPPIQNPDLNKLVQQAFDPNAIQSIFSQLQAIRDTIHLGGGDPYDPKAGSSTIYFDPTDSTKLQTFDEMKNDLGQKGDIKSATEAQKALSDALSVLSSTTQGVNSALNEQVSQQTGFEKNVQSFIASLMKSLIDLLNATVQNISK